MAGASNGSYVGLFMRELPPDWWLPEGYTLSPSVSVPILATDPVGNRHFIYAVPGFQPTPDRVRSIAETIRDELGSPPTQGFGPQTREALGMNRTDLPGAISRTFWGPFDAMAQLLDLANYGIDATIISTTEGMAHAGWITETSAKELREDLRMLAIVSAVELGRGGEGPAEIPRARIEAARLSALRRARLADWATVPRVVRMETASGLPAGRAFAVLDVVEADPAGFSTSPQTLRGWLDRVRAGKAFDLQNEARYRFNQLYIVKENGRGYWVLDSYAPRARGIEAGPVSRKFTQLADIQTDSAVAMLREAYRKYRPGMRIADVPSRPLRLRDTHLTGQLWLEVPVQTKPIPAVVLQEAQSLSIKIRDIDGKVY